MWQVKNEKSIEKCIYLHSLFAFEIALQRRIRPTLQSYFGALIDSFIKITLDSGITNSKQKPRIMKKSNYAKRLICRFSGTK
jgi:hypothetical protein